jgi:DNA-binding FadR family transcriptional regulator
MELRVPLEVQTVTLATERSAPEDVAELAHNIDQMGQATDAAYLRECDYAFHHRLAEITRNPLLVTLLDTLVGLIGQLQQAAYSLRDAARDTVREHRCILDAVQAHDAVAARKAMLEHLEAVAQRLQAVGADRRQDSA